MWQPTPVNLVLGRLRNEIRLQSKFKTSLGYVRFLSPLTPGLPLLPHKENKKKKRTGDVAQLGKCLTRKHEVLGSIPNTA